LPEGTLVLVADGRKALVLRNHGDALHPNLKVERVFDAPPNPPTHEQGTDAPDRVIMGGIRSAVEPTDWHQMAERDFAGKVASALEAAHGREPIKALVVAAPPRALADLRRAMSEEVRRVVVAEIDKDLTKHPVHEIERHLT
jgi:protein required for attachment to host cells